MNKHDWGRGDDGAIIPGYKCHRLFLLQPHPPASHHVSSVSSQINGRWRGAGRGRFTELISAVAAQLMQGNFPWGGLSFSRSTPSFTLIFYSGGDWRELSFPKRKTSSKWKSIHICLGWIIVAVEKLLMWYIPTLASQTKLLHFTDKQNKRLRRWTAGVVIHHEQDSFIRQ